MKEQVIDGNVNVSGTERTVESYEKEIKELKEQNELLRAQVDRIYNELQRYQNLYFTTGLK